MRNCVWLAVVLLGACDGEDYGTNPPTEAHDDHFIIDEDDTGTITGYALKSNDQLRYSGASPQIIEPPMHGTFEETAYDAKYIPDAGYFGTDRFVYEIDGSVATVTIEITSDGVSIEDAMRIDTTGADALALGDLDADGHQDLVVANAETDSIAILVNRTTMPKDFVVTPYRFEGGRDPLDVAVADLDGDGRLDIVTASKSDGLVILRNITPVGGPLSFESPLVIPETSTVATIGVVAADLDGDGKVDLASLLDKSGMYTTNPGAITVRLNTTLAGGITFGPSTEFETPKTPIDLLATDADEDGRPDLAVLSSNVGELSLFLNAMSVGATAPAFAARIDRQTASKPRNMFLADLDGDGDLEIAVMHDLVIWIYANRGLANVDFEAARVLDLPAAASYGFAAAVDLDGQGAVDVLAVTGEAKPVAQLFNDSLGEGSFMFDLAEGQLADTATRRRAYFGETRGIVAMDLDGVPPLEIVVATRKASDNYGHSGGGTYVLYEH